MRFVPTSKARGLDTDKDVFTLDTDGNYGIGRMVEERRNKKEGVVIVFEVPQYFNEEAPATGPKLVTNVAFVSVPKAKKEKTEPAEGGEEKVKKAGKKKDKDKASE